MAKMNKLVCLNCDKVQAEAREFYLTKSRVYEKMIESRRGRMLICKTCLFEIYDSLMARYDNDELKALYHLCMMFDICYDKRLAESSKFQQTTIRDKYSIIKNYMKNINSSIGGNAGVGRSSIDSGHIVLDDEVIRDIERKYIKEEDIPKKENVIDISNDIKLRWGIGYKDDEYMFLENTYKEFTDVYESRTPAQRLIFRNMAKSMLEGDKALRNSNPAVFEKMNNVVSKLMTDGNIKPIQEASLAEDDSFTIGKWIDKFEKERPIPEPLDVFEDVDKIGLYINKWFTKQMQRVFDLSTGEEDDR